MTRDEAKFEILISISPEQDIVRPDCQQAGPTLMCLMDRDLRTGPDHVGPSRKKNLSLGRKDAKTNRRSLSHTRNVSIIKNG